MNIEDFLQRLQNVKQTSSGWQARCPGHEDRTPSLSIKLGEGRRIVLHCHAGCDPQRVLEALGLSMRDLFDSEGSTRQREPEGGPSFATQREVVDDTAARLKGWRLVRAFEYSLADGTPVFCAMRFERGVDDKTFRIASCTGTGWVARDLPGLRPLYALPTLGAAELVCVFEGETCCDVAAELGLVRTTSAGGASAAKRTDWSPLAGKHVCILPDNDEPGRTYAEDVTEALLALHPPAIVRIVELPGLAEHEDIVDFVKRARADGEADDAIRARVLALVDSAEVITREGDAPSSFVPFPVEVFPDLFRTFIKFYSKADSVDPSFLAVPLLSAIAATIGNVAEIELKPGWVQPSVLWTCCVGVSGSRKSVALKRVLRPLHRMQSKARKAHEQEVRSKRKRESDARRARANASEDDPTDDNGADHVPCLRRYIVTDATAEALLSILAKQTWGVLVARDELSGLVLGFNQYKARGGADEAVWLALFDAEPAYIERKTGEDRSLAVDRPAVSITGGIQPGILADVFSRQRQENGLLARILFAFPPEVEASWNTDSPPEVMVERVEAVFEHLSSLSIPLSADGVLSPHRLTLTTEAQALFAEYYVAHARLVMRMEDGASASYSKLLGVCGRLALVLELLRWAESETHGLLPLQVSAEGMRGAIRLAQWFGREALRVQRLLQMPESSTSDRLEAWIESKGGTVTPRDVQRRGRGGTTVGASRTVLQALVDAGRGHWLDAERTRLRLGHPRLEPSDVGTSERRSGTTVDAVDRYAEQEREAIQQLERDEERRAREQAGDDEGHSWKETDS